MKRQKNQIWFCSLVVVWFLIVTVAPVVANERGVVGEQVRDCDGTTSTYEITHDDLEIVERHGKQVLESIIVNDHYFALRGDGAGASRMDAGESAVMRFVASIAYAHFRCDQPASCEKFARLEFYQPRGAYFEDLSLCRPVLVKRGDDLGKSTISHWRCAGAIKVGFVDERHGEIIPVRLDDIQNPFPSIDAGCRPKASKTPTVASDR